MHALCSCSSMPEPVDDVNLQVPLPNDIEMPLTPPDADSPQTSTQPSLPVAAIAHDDSWGHHALLEEDVAGPEASVSLDVIAQPWQQWPEPTYDRLRETDTPLARLAGWPGLSKDAGKDAGLKEVPVRAIKNQSQVCCDCCRGWGLPT